MDPGDFSTKSANIWLIKAVFSRISIIRRSIQITSFKYTTNRDPSFLPISPLWLWGPQDAQGQPPLAHCRLIPFVIFSMQLASSSMEISRRSGRQHFNSSSMLINACRFRRFGGRLCSWVNSTPVTSPSARRSASPRVLVCSRACSASVTVHSCAPNVPPRACMHVDTPARPSAAYARHQRSRTPVTALGPTSGRAPEPLPCPCTSSPRT
ncbi:hypothetical protein CRG98_007359 [Punica granatum]|uniref:Uncharacterized protein n=1 Tax=Punica granatum TaxID=22663 RepID=A0A2I0KUZ1_PUNGR|nr:hypothetical protein CRG98_007359 [Punica granatum]